MRRLDNAGAGDAEEGPAPYEKSELPRCIGDGVGLAGIILESPLDHLASSTSDSSDLKWAIMILPEV